MKRHRHYRRDGKPTQLGAARMIELRFMTTCSGCDSELPAGSQALWQPGSRLVYGERCGCAVTRKAAIEQAERDREAALADEAANATLKAM